MISTSAITQNMLAAAAKRAGSASAKRLMYLKAFGITDPNSLDMPSVFDQKMESTWRAFTVEHKANDRTDVLNLCLSFLRYCQLLKVDPFVPGFTFRDATTGSNRINVTSIRKSIADTELTERLAFVSTKIKRARIQAAFEVTRHKVTATMRNGHSMLVAAYVLTPNNKKLDVDAFIKANSLLSNFGSVPQALRRNVSARGKEQNIPAASLLTGAGTLGWCTLMQFKIPPMTVCAIRAKGNEIVLKVVTQALTHEGMPSPAEQAKLLSKFKLLTR